MRSDERVGVLIAGAGPTGLGAGRRLMETGCGDWRLVEATATPGGLATSYVDAHGFTWDVGGHVQFSHYEYFDQAMDQFLGQDGWIEHERESWVWIKNRFVPYPFQNNVRLLPPADAERCLHGLVDIANRPPRQASNFADWMNDRFGSGIVELFMRPYNRKVWAHEPEMMSASWVGERVAVTDLRRVISNVVHNRDDVSWGPNNTFRFPKHGGTGAIWSACAATLPIDKLRFRWRLASIDPVRKIATMSNGRTIAYGSLVSTIPLPELARACGQDGLLKDKLRCLPHSSSNIVGIGLRGAPPQPLSRKCWMYFPENDCPFYRVTVFSNYSPNNVPDISKQWSLMAEVSESRFKPVNAGSLERDVLQGAINTGLIASMDSVETVWSRRFEYGYPVPGVDRDRALNDLIPHFEQYDILTRGRFGAWKYEVSNQDHSFMQGVEAAERIVNGTPEVTVFDAEYVNGRKNKWPYERRAA
jgi:protoporphyrinogen oxidase